MHAYFFEVFYFYFQFFFSTFHGNQCVWFTRGFVGAVCRGQDAYERREAAKSARRADHAQQLKAELAAKDEARGRRYTFSCSPRRLFFCGSFVFTFKGGCRVVRWS